MILLRPSTLDERKNFYESEFDIRRVESWFNGNKANFPQLFAVDLGSDTRIIKFKDKMNKMISLVSKDSEKKFPKYLPEDIYYDRNRYRNPQLALKKLDFKNAFSDKNFLGQELAFDIDSNNIECLCKEICSVCLKKTINKSLKAIKILNENFKRISLVYSGRGMHVHVFDRSAFKLDIKERQQINRRLSGCAIDPWVSRGRIRLIRLPYSLNGLVSRVVTPISLDEALDFNPMTDALPNFLR